MAALKWFCLCFALGNLCIAVFFSIQTDTRLEHLDHADTKETPTEVNKPFIVERQGDRILWRLQAKHAQQKMTKMYLLEPKLELFDDSSANIPIQGDEAWFEPLAQQVSFHGHVSVLYQGWILSCDQLEYNVIKGEMFVPLTFELKKQGTVLRGQQLRINIFDHDLKMNNVWFEDEVILERTL